jgi:protein tyrosine phosphatase
MWIENVSLKDIQTGYHYDPGSNSLLIQIVDPGNPFPTSKFQFKEVHQFQFFDAEDGYTNQKEPVIDDEQAQKIVEILKHAHKNYMNVIVHCVAGMCRSGAVVEAGIAIGFQDVDKPRMPNTTIKLKLLNEVNRLNNKKLSTTQYFF